jgi:hypothetical protein
MISRSARSDDLCTLGYSRIETGEHSSIRIARNTGVDDASLNPLAAIERARRSQYRARIPGSVQPAAPIEIQISPGEPLKPMVRCEFPVVFATFGKRAMMALLFETNVPPAAS